MLDSSGSMGGKKMNKLISHFLFKPNTEKNNSAWD